MTAELSANERADLEHAAWMEVHGYHAAHPYTTKLLNLALRLSGHKIRDPRPPLADCIEPVK